MKYATWLTVLALSISSWASTKYKASGMVMKVDAPHKTMVVSCDTIPGYMAAMTMPFEVRKSDDLLGISPGMVVDFTLVTDKESAFAENLKIRPYEGVEQDPLTARRLKLLNRLNHPDEAKKILTIGQSVPDFTLIDQQRHKVSLSQYSGKVVAMNFIYTSCTLPTFCYRITNNFGVLQRRFSEKLGRDLVLITVTFDPQHDQPEQMAHYAETWKANPATWHFLTGPVPDVQRVTNEFGMDYFPDEGLMNHSLHTAIIDRNGKLFANIEGNQFTAEQLADLVQTVLK